MLFRKRKAWKWNNEYSSYIKDINGEKTFTKWELNIFKKKESNLVVKAPIGFFIYGVKPYWLILSETEKENLKIESHIKIHSKYYIFICGWPFTKTSYGKQKFKMNWANFKIHYHTLRSIYSNKTKGVFQRVLIKGFGRKGWQTRTILQFKIGHSYIFKKTVPKNLILTIFRKKTLIKFYSNKKSLIQNFTKQLINIRPTFKYKDTGVRYFNIKPKIKKRRATIY